MTRKETFQTYWSLVRNMQQCEPHSNKILADFLEENGVDSFTVGRFRSAWGNMGHGFFDAGKEALILILHGKTDPTRPLHCQ